VRRPRGFARRALNRQLWRTSEATRQPARARRARAPRGCAPTAGAGRLVSRVRRACAALTRPGWARRCRVRRSLLAVEHVEEEGKAMLYLARARRLRLPLAAAAVAPRC
jgi:hypothetical protein